MKISSVFGLFLLLVSNLNYAQSNRSEGSFWYAATTEWGCLMNFAVREPPFGNDSLPYVELSYFYASENPSAHFDIPLNELRLSISFIDYSRDDQLELTLRVDGRNLFIDEFDYANGVSLFRASAEQTSTVLAAMKSQSAIVVELTLAREQRTLGRSLGEANFTSEIAKLEQCLENR